MARLPKVGGDSGNWGDILNDYLSQSHNDDGTLKTDTVGAPQLKQNAVTGAAIANSSISNAKIADAAVNTAQLADGSVTAAKLTGIGEPNGIASLDDNGKLPEAQLPERLGEEELNGAIGDEVEAAVAPKANTADVYSRTAADPRFAFRKGSRTIVLGDSLDASAKGWFGYFTNRGKIPVSRNAGIGGQRLDQHDERFETDVVPYAPDILIFGGATNDLTQGRTDAQIRASVTSIYTKAVAAGITPVVRTSPPTNNAATAGGTLTAHRQRILSHNAWLRDWATVHGITVLDLYAAIADPITGGYLSGYTDDGTHPTKAGYSLIANRLLISGLPWPFRSDFSFARVVTDPSNMFANGVCASDSDSNGVPDSWTKLGLTTSLVDDSTIVGKWLHGVNVADATTALIQAEAPSSSFSVGDHVQIVGRVKASAATWTTPTSQGVRVLLQFVGGSTQINMFDYVHEGLDGTFSYEQIVPSGTTAIRFQCHTIGKANETIDVAGLAGRNLTRLRA